MKALIVGVDPGSTSAVAAVDLEGELVLLESGKNFPPSEMIRTVIDEGKPVVVTSDREKMPSKVEKIARSLGAHEYVPGEDLSQSRKRKLGEGENSHEKDASASALNAYRNLQQEIDKIEKYSDRMERGRARIAEEYFSDGPFPEEKEDDSEDVEAREEGPEPDEPDPEKQRMERKIENLEEQVERLKSELGEVRKEKKELRKKLTDVKQGKKDEMIKDHEISKREGRINDLEEKIEDLEDELESSRVRESQYRKAVRKLAEGGELLSIVGYGTEELPEKAVTRSEEIKDELESRGVNIYTVDELEGIELKEYMVVDELPGPKSFEKVIEDYRESR
ncbi:MAG: DUF460 domain-containing protein [Candidatus Nanohaloarchaea archaeon]